MRELGMNSRPFPAPVPHANPVPFPPPPDSRLRTKLRTSGRLGLCHSVIFFEFAAGSDDFFCTEAQGDLPGSQGEAVHITVHTTS